MNTSIFKKFRTTLVALTSIVVVACAPQVTEKKADPQTPPSTVQAAVTRPTLAYQPVVVRTETQTMKCVADGLKADGRTEAQARNLQAVDEVTIAGVKRQLGAGNSYYSLCKGPSAAERLAVAEAHIAKMQTNWGSYANSVDAQEASSMAAIAALQDDLREAKKFNPFSLEFLIALLMGAIVGAGVFYAFARERLSKLAATPRRDDEPYSEG